MTTRFIDTDVLLFAISRDPAERDKAECANEILAARDVALSVHVLQNSTFRPLVIPAPVC